MSGPEYDERWLVISGALALAYADLPCSNGCGCEPFDYCAQDEITKAQQVLYALEREAIKGAA